MAIRPVAISWFELSASHSRTPTLLYPYPAAFMAWSKMSDAEVKLARKWYVEDDESTATIAERLGRNQSTLTRLLVQRKARKVQGRPPALTTVAVDRLEKRLSGMIMKATVAVEFTLIAFSIQPTNDCLDTARRCGRGGGYWTLGE